MTSNVIKYELTSDECLTKDQLQLTLENEEYYEVDLLDDQKTLIFIATGKWAHQIGKDFLQTLALCGITVNGTGELFRIDGDLPHKIFTIEYNEEIEQEQYSDATVEE